MKLYLIRHGETVDNVAGLYAGIRDSTLTNHGVEQAMRLGEYFAENDVKFTRIFASPLSRAFKTAQAVLKAQSRIPTGEHNTVSSGLEITKVPDLIERDFGYYEGKPFHTRPGSKSYQGDAHNEDHKSQPGFVDVESDESMAARIDRFLNQHLMPLFGDGAEHEEKVIAIVSHGMLLSHFWRRLLLRLPRKSLIVAPEIIAARGNVFLEHIGGWSNTGYMELSFKNDEKHDVKVDSKAAPSAQQASTKEVDTLATPVPPTVPPEDAQVTLTSTQDEEPKPESKADLQALTGWATTIVAIDSKEHLIGLKRQRGGIGSLAHDEGQKRLDAFFKRPRLT